MYNALVDLVKAKEQAHVVRRADRDEKFKPHDIKATIPAYAAQAEIDRQVIRDADDAVQVSIDAVVGTTGDVDGPEVVALKAALASL